MATLKDHQQAMVELLASGSGIPASASRLAHAMHDVVDMLIAAFPNVPLSHDVPQGPKRLDATTPGLNDKALAGDLEACRPKTTPAERRVKELENTVKQLRASNAKLRGERDMLHGRLLAHEHPTETEQAGCRRDDTDWATSVQDSFLSTAVALARKAIEDADTQVCEHYFTSTTLDGEVRCAECGALLK